jgi:hypothetical protein
MAFQNDPTYAAGDRVHVYETAGVAALAASGYIQIVATPRPAVVVNEHPNEPGTLEVRYTDAAGGSELVADTQRLRHIK